MSLKARIEAVIYAAEEPVTLAQLATLFRDEALASRAARLAPAEPLADPDSPTASDLPAEFTAVPAGGAAALADAELSDGLSADGGGTPDEGRATEADSDDHAIPSEPGAQN